jgi:O-antigen ligase
MLNRSRSLSRGPRPALTAPAATAANQLLAARLESLNIGALWRTLFRQSPAVWAILLYIFFEYVRPQSVWRTLDIMPYPQICLLSSTLLVLLEGRLSFRGTTPLWIWVALFSVVIALSGVFAVYPSWSWDFKDVWINWLLLMLIVGAGIRTRTEFFLLLVSFVLWNIKMSQFGARAWVANGFSANAVGVSGGPGWFQNSGEFGIQMCIFLPLVSYFAFGLWPRLSRNRRLFAAGVVFSALISIVVGSSRGAFLGMLVVAAWAVALSPYRVRATVIALPLAVLTWLVLPQRTKERLSESGQDRDSMARLTYWKDGLQIAKEYPVLGIGYNNWLPYYRARYNPEGELPHNFLIETVTQTGYVGLAVFGGMMIAYFRQNARTRRLTRAEGKAPDRVLWAIAYGLDGAMVGFMASGFFVSVLWYPYIWMNFALSMALCRVAYEAVGQRHRAQPHRAQAMAAFGAATS